MSIIKSEDNKKWVNAFIAILSILVGFVVIRFVGQLGEWFDLEAKISNFLIVTQIVGIVFGLITFFAVSKHKEAGKHLDEVYSELVKVIWPDSDSVFKMTIGLVIGLSIVSGIFLLIDYMFRQLLSLVY